MHLKLGLLQIRGDKMKQQIQLGAYLFSKHVTKITGITAATFILSGVLSGAAFADKNAENGKVLYEKSKCQKCHGTEVFTRKDRKVKSLKALETQVRMCDSQLSVNWFDEDISDVVAYLNKAFYKFDTQSNKAAKTDETKLAD